MDFEISPVGVAVAVTGLVVAAVGVAIYHDMKRDAEIRSIAPSVAAATTRINRRVADMVNESNRAMRAKMHDLRYGKFLSEVEAQERQFQRDLEISDVTALDKNVRTTFGETIACGRVRNYVEVSIDDMQCELSRPYHVSENMLIRHRTTISRMGAKIDALRDGFTARDLRSQVSSITNTVEKAERHYSFMVKHNELVRQGKVITFSGLWRNGTGYFDNISSFVNKNNTEVGYYASYDDTTRRYLIIHVHGAGVVVMFERYTDGKDAVLVANASTRYLQDVIGGTTVNTEFFYGFMNGTYIPKRGNRNVLSSLNSVSA